MSVILWLSLLPSPELSYCSDIIQRTKDTEKGHFCSWIMYFHRFPLKRASSPLTWLLSSGHAQLLRGYFWVTRNGCEVSWGLISLHLSSSHSSLGFCCLRGRCQEAAWTLPGFRSHRPLSATLTVTGYSCDLREILLPPSFSTSFPSLHTPFFFPL